jgi:flagellar biosynthesis component FlhA
MRKKRGFSSQGLPHFLKFMIAVATSVTTLLLLQQKKKKRKKERKKKKRKEKKRKKKSENVKAKKYTHRFLSMLNT